MVDRHTQARLISGLSGTWDEIFEELMHHGDAELTNKPDGKFGMVIHGIDAEGPYTMYFELTDPDQDGTQEAYLVLTLDE